MKEGWIDDARLKDISHEKLSQLKTLADSADAQNRTCQMQMLAAMVRNPQMLDLHFTKKEIDLLFSVLKEYASQRELSMLSQAMRMFQRSI